MSLDEALLDLQRLTERLRRDCPWDREQTAATIVPHTVEEAYEVADAALGGDDEKLLDELGDLLFQVYFLALLLSEDGHGDLEDVARAVHAKLVQRHPHVFGDVEARTAGRVRENWERIKREEEGREGVFHHVPENLPALLYARKVQRRAAAVGFEYPDAAGALRDLDDGQHRNEENVDGWFTTAFFHHPDELEAEIREAGFELDSVVGIEGPGAWFSAPADVQLWAARVTERDLTMRAVSPHLVAVARRP